MLVVVVGVVPLIWRLAMLILDKQPLEEQYAIKRAFYTIIIGLLYYLLIFGSQYLSAIEYLLGLPASLLMANMHVELILRWCARNERIKNEQGYGAAFLDCGKLIVMAIILLTIVVICKWKGLA